MMPLPSLSLISLCVMNMVIYLYDNLKYKPGLSRLKKRIFAASSKNFCMKRKNFCSLRIFAIFCNTHFFVQHFTYKVFEKFKRLTSKIFAWWEKISACCKNHPSFCNQEKPRYSLFFRYWWGCEEIWDSRRNNKSFAWVAGSLAHSYKIC